MSKKKSNPGLSDFWFGVFLTFTIIFVVSTLTYGYIETSENEEEARFNKCVKVLTYDNFGPTPVSRAGLCSLLEDYR